MQIFLSSLPINSHVDLCLSNLSVYENEPESFLFLEFGSLLVKESILGSVLAGPVRDLEIIKPSSSQLSFCVKKTLKYLVNNTGFSDCMFLSCHVRVSE